MAELTENTRLAERLASIASALVKPPATNGHAEVVATSLSDELIDAWAKGTVPFIRECITDAVTPLMERIAELEKKKGIAPLARRLAELEAAALTDGDCWKKEISYKPNQQVTSDGTLWLCKKPNVNSKPPSDCWRQQHRTISRGGR